MNYPRLTVSSFPYLCLYISLSCHWGYWLLYTPICCCCVFQLCLNPTAISPSIVYHDHHRSITHSSHTQQLQNSDQRWWLVSPPPLHVPGYCDLWEEATGVLKTKYYKNLIPLVRLLCDKRDAPPALGRRLWIKKRGRGNDKLMTFTSQSPFTAYSSDHQHWRLLPSKRLDHSINQIKGESHLIQSMHRVTWIMNVQQENHVTWLLSIPSALVTWSATVPDADCFSSIRGGKQFS